MNNPRSRMDLISDDNAQRTRPFGQPLCFFSDEYLDHLNYTEKKPTIPKRN